MAGLSERNIQIVRQLVEAAPDVVVGSLQTALAEAGGDSALASVRRLVEAEAKDRKVRNAVLQPIAPMCVGEGRDKTRLVFPARALALFWRGLKTIAPREVAAAAAELIDFRPGESSPEPYDRLVRTGLNAFRAGEQREFVLAAEACDQARSGGAAAFAACLDLAPVVRRALPKLARWTMHFDKETTASARLAYKDAIAVAEDAGPRFFEMLAAQLSYSWMVLRIISAVMDKPTERYLADSEMACFGSRVMRDIENTLVAVSRLNADGGPEVARAAAKEVELVTMKISEVETFVELSREHGWGRELVKHKKSLAAVVEGLLRTTEKLVAAALPTELRGWGRARRNTPNLSIAPDPAAIRRATTLLTFVKEIRTSANYGGFSAARLMTLEKLGEMLDDYVADVLDLLQSGDAKDDRLARAYLDLAAEVTLLVRDQQAADLVRRRVAGSSSTP